jgi:hypothetical protein
MHGPSTQNRWHNIMKVVEIDLVLEIVGESDFI